MVPSRRVASASQHRRLQDPDLHHRLDSPMSHRRRATCDSEHLTTTPSKRSRIDRGHAAHFPRPKYKPHVDSGIGKNFHSLRYPLSLLPYRSWAALNNGEVSGGVCPQCGKDRDATPYQRKLFLVAERLSWGSGTTSRQQKEQNEVALWAVNADLDVFEPAVEDDEVIMGGRHSRENKWYPFRDQLEADLALKIVEKANILSEASWKVWKDVALLRQTGRKPLGELGSSSSQSPRWSSRKNKRDAGTASDSSMPKTLFSDPPLEDVAIMKCSYETLSDFYSILDKIEKTSPVAARYLEAYAERLHVDACKSCWFKNTIVDLPDEGQAMGSVESIRLAGGAGLPPTGAFAVLPDTQPSAIGSCVYSNSHLLQGPNFSKRSVSLHHGHSSRGPAGPGHVLAPRPWAQLPPSRAPLVAAAAAALVPRQRQATEWLQRHFSVDATTHTTMNVLWQTYRDTFPGVPQLGYAEFVDRVLETFAASKLLPLGDGTFMVQGVRQNVTIGEAQSSHSTNQNRGSHNMLSLVPATHAKEESLFEWLRRTYEPYQYAEVSATQLIEAYRSDFGRSPWASLPLLDVSKEIPGSRSSLRNGKVIYFNLRRKSNCHAAAPDSQQAQHGATTSASAGTQDGVAALEEPMRSAQWLRCHYIADPDSEVPQQALFAAYRERFGTSQKLNGVEFLDSVERTFPTTSRGRNAAQDYVIKGLMPKPSDVSIKQRTPITSQPRLPQADSGLSSTTEGKLTVLVEARDKPPVYVKVSPVSFENQRREFNSDDSTCRPQLSPISSMA